MCDYDDFYELDEERFVEVKAWLDTQPELRSRIINGRQFAVEDNSPFTYTDLEGIINGMNMDMPYTAREIYGVILKEEALSNAHLTVRQLKKLIQAIPDKYDEKQVMITNPLKMYSPMSDMDSHVPLDNMRLTCENEQCILQCLFTFEGYDMII